MTRKLQRHQYACCAPSYCFLRDLFVSALIARCNKIVSTSIYIRIRTLFNEFLRNSSQIHYAANESTRLHRGRKGNEHLPITFYRRYLMHWLRFNQSPVTVPETGLRFARYLTRRLPAPPSLFLALSIIEGVIFPMKGDK